MSVEPPIRQNPSANWEHIELFRRVREALFALPAYFQTETVIAGIMATDVFTLNAALGATIEEQVVRTLNDMRPIWDPVDRYKLYSFTRQAQTFPDVLLRRHAQSGDSDIIMGIELKGWYLLAKEGEPSFRFQVTPSACNPQDLIVVVPWVLANVIAGSPRVFIPYVESARYAAEYRNYHWRHLRETRLSTEIHSPLGVTPYPRKSDAITDKPDADAGGNFGRFARTGIMDEYLRLAASERLCGIEARHWRAFFKAFQDQTTAAEIEKEMDRLVEELSEQSSTISGTTLQRVKAILAQLHAILFEDR